MNNSSYFSVTIKTTADSTMSAVLCDVGLVKRFPVNCSLFRADSGIESQVREGMEEEEKDGGYDRRFTWV